MRSILLISNSTFLIFAHWITWAIISFLIWRKFSKTVLFLSDMKKSFTKPCFTSINVVEYFIRSALYKIYNKNENDNSYKEPTFIKSRISEQKFANVKYAFPLIPKLPIFLLDFSRFFFFLIFGLALLTLPHYILFLD